MTIYGGPDIETDGLILRLQAANNKSYIGSGTSWKDLSGNARNFTLQQILQLKSFLSLLTRD